MLSAFSPEAAAQYEADASGPLSSNVGEGCTFLRSRPDLPAPDLQFIFGPLHLHEEFLGVITDDAYFFGPALVKPTSRGRVTLRSPVFHAKPRILHNYLGTEEDRRAMIEGMRIAMDVGEQHALDSARGERFAYPASDSDADIMDFVQRRTHTVYHPVRRARSARSWTASCGCTASTGCASWMPRSCRRCRAATRTRR